MKKKLIIFFLAKNLGIDAYLKKAESLGVAEQKAINDDHGLIGSIGNGLGVVVNQLTTPILTGVSMALPSLNYFIHGTLDGFLKDLKNGNLVDALTDLLGGFSSSSITILTAFIAKGLANSLKGKQIKFNFVCKFE